MLKTSGYLKSSTVALICCLLLAFIAACAPAPAPPPPSAPTERVATLLVSPTSGKAAAIITIGGTGFLSGEEIEIVLAVGELRHGLGTEKEEKIIANEYGAFRVVSGIPVKTSPGTYTIKATGNKGSIGTCSIEVK